MTGHKLAKKLLELPDLPVLYEIYNGNGNEAYEPDTVEVGYCGEDYIGSDKKPWKREGIVLR